MARGWESKSVEEQQSEFGHHGETSKSPVTAEARQHASQVQALQLQRARVLDQLKQSTNPRFSELMQQELAFLDRKLADLDGSKS